MNTEIQADESVGAAVVRAVCAVEDRHFRSLRPLIEVVDPDALDALFGSRPDGEARIGGRLSFVLGRCRVTVDNGEFLTIEPLDTHPVGPGNRRRRRLSTTAER